ncbi:MAG: hypothetical protein QM687_12460 [Ferruginibacter sp.]
MNTENETGTGKSITLTVPDFKPKYVSGGTYLVALLLFFLPFLNIKCNDQTIASITGKDFVTGFNMKEKAGDSFFGGMFKDRNKTTGNESDTDSSRSALDKKEDKIEKPNVLAIISFVAGILALVFVFVKLNYARLMASIAGGIAALLLLLIFFQFKSQTTELSSGGMGFDIKMSFTIWFFLSIILFIVGAYFSYKTHLQEETEKHRLAMDEYRRGYEENTNSQIGGDAGYAAGNDLNA